MHAPSKIMCTATDSGCLPRISMPLCRRRKSNIAEINLSVFELIRRLTLRLCGELLGTDRYRKRLWAAIRCLLSGALRWACSFAATIRCGRGHLAY